MRDLSVFKFEKFRCLTHGFRKACFNVKPARLEKGLILKFSAKEVFLCQFFEEISPTMHAHSCEMICTIPLKFAAIPSKTRLLLRTSLSRVKFDSFVCKRSHS